MFGLLWGWGHTGHMLHSYDARGNSEVTTFYSVQFEYHQVQNFLSTNFEKGQLSPSLKSFPLAEVFVLIGFYLIYIIEEVTHALIDRCAAGGQPGHNHGHDEMQILNQAGGVTHKNGSDQQPAFMSAMRGFLVVLALSLHEMFEGIALGLATTEK